MLGAEEIKIKWHSLTPPGAYILLRIGVTIGSNDKIQSAQKNQNGTKYFHWGRDRMNEVSL